MTREQESDSTLLSEERGREREILSPQQVGRQESLEGLYSREIPEQLTTPP